MRLSKLNNLYRQIILEHSQHPHHHGHLPRADKSLELRNPTCGDVLTVELAVKDGKVSEVAFSGTGCTISQASASLMTDEVIGKTPKEIEKAQHARLKEGKHIIPVPTMELKPHFRGYLIDPIKTMWRRRTLKKQDQDTLGQIGSEGFERSVVRPAFSYYGRLTFDDDVIIKLIRNGLKKVVGVDESSVISFKKSDKGQNGLVVDMAVVIEHGYPVKALMQQVQKSVRNEIEYITGMSIERMSIKVKNIIETKRKIVKV